MILRQIAVGLATGPVGQFGPPIGCLAFTTRFPFDGASFRGLPLGGIMIRLAIMVYSRYPSEKGTGCRKLARKDCASTDSQCFIAIVCW